MIYAGHGYSGAVSTNRNKIIFNYLDAEQNVAENYINRNCESKFGVTVIRHGSTLGV